MIRILLVSTYPLFSRGIESLLCHEPDFLIVGHETDPDRALEQMAELRPDIVIVDNHEPASDRASLIMRILQEHPNVTVIGLNVHHNTLHVYRQQDWVAKEVQDLTAAIRTSAAQRDNETPTRAP